MAQRGGGPARVLNQLRLSLLALVLLLGLASAQGQDRKTAAGDRSSKVVSVAPEAKLIDGDDDVDPEGAHACQAAWKKFLHACASVHRLAACVLRALM